MRTYTKIDNILDHKENLNKFKIIEIMQSVFFDHSGIKLAFKKNGKIIGKSPDIWKLYSTLVNNPWVTKEVSMSIKKCIELSERSTYQKLWDTAKSELRGL